ncbi:MAG: ATP-binding protein [Syntrophaceticus sp.]|jgi:NAD-dependent dihydropyrimidine dehydrogenase PreA subunit
MPPKVDVEKCTGCGTCVDVCPSEVFETEDDKAKVVRPEDCTDCESCVEECPEEAITLEDE